MRRLRFTFRFAIVSAAVFAVAGVVVAHALGRIATDNAVLSAERETERALSHLLADASGRVENPADGSITLELLAQPDGLPRTFDSASDPLGFIGATLYTPDGSAAWSTSPLSPDSQPGDPPPGAARGRAFEPYVDTNASSMDIPSPLYHA